MSIIKKCLLLGFSALALAFVTTFTPGHTALAAAPYYEGKAIRLIVPMSPGGTYDQMARLAAANLPRHIPGNPKVIVVNMPGGGGLIGERFLADAPKDGLTIGHFPAGHVVKQLTGIAKNIDFTKFEWLGSASGSNYVVLINAKLPYRTVDDLRNAPAPIKFGALGRGDYVGSTAQILKAMLGLNLRIVFGYKGYNEITLVLRQGELDGVATALITTQAHPLTKEMIDSRFLRIMLLMKGSIEPDAEVRGLVKDVPDARDYIKDPKDRQIYETYMRHFAVTRPFCAPPGTNPQALEILRRAFWETLNDKAFAAAAQKNGFILSPEKYDVVDSYIRNLLTMPESQKTRLLEIWK